MVSIVHRVIGCVNICYGYWLLKSKVLTFQISGVTSWPEQAKRAHFQEFQFVNMDNQFPRSI